MLDEFMEKLWNLTRPSSPIADPEKLSITEPETSPTTQPETWSTKDGDTYAYHLNWALYGTAMWISELVILKKLCDLPMCLVIYGLLLFTPIVHTMLLAILSHKCLGGAGKLLVEVINFSLVMVLRQYVNFHVFMLYMLLTGHLHAIVRILHLAYDVGARDVLLGLLMQFLGYVTSENLYGSAAVCLMFGAVTLCRYKLYTPPSNPIDNKKQED